ncbi:MAG: exonuclease SbcCD subunit D [Pseudanabaena sp. ELA607]
MKLIHLADLHLGYRAYHRVNSQGVNQREADVFRSFKEVLDRIITINPDVVLIAGDIFHVPRPSNFAVITTQSLLYNFRQKCPAPLVMIAGNHESVRSTDNRCILELLSVLPETYVVTNAPQVVSLQVKDDKTMRICCLPHNALDSKEPLPLIRPDDGSNYNLLMLHGTVDHERINDYGGYTVPSDLMSLNWDYVACGHYHSQTHLGKFAYYAGAIERTSNNIWAEAAEAKGFMEFDLDYKTERFHPLVAPRLTIDLPLIDAAKYESEQINHLIIDHAKQFKIENSLARQKIINMVKSVQCQLDYREIRKLQTEAVHYLLDIRPPEILTRNASISNNRGETKGLLEQAEAFFQERNLPLDVSREAFVAKGLAYLNQNLT